MGRDACSCFDLRQRKPVSIHAPTWGATLTRENIQLAAQVSIHAPTWGATKDRIFGMMPDDGFNPRAHVGRDWETRPLVYEHEFQSTRPRGARLDGSIYYFAVGVSIHAPTWGATILSILANIGARVSIHAPTWGATHIACGVGDDALFQSTRPRGARPPNGTAFTESNLFQSTRPRGARPSNGGN